MKTVREKKRRRALSFKKKTTLSRTKKGGKEIIHRASGVCCDDRRKKEARSERRNRPYRKRCTKTATKPGGGEGPDFHIGRKGGGDGISILDLGRKKKKDQMRRPLWEKNTWRFGGKGRTFFRRKSSYLSRWGEKKAR